MIFAPAVEGVSASAHSSASAARPAVFVRGITGDLTRRTRVRRALQRLWRRQTRRLELGDVDRLRALVAVLFLEFDLGPLGERLVAVPEDSAVVDEEVPAALIGRDEAETL